MKILAGVLMAVAAGCAPTKEPPILSRVHAFAGLESVGDGAPVIPVLGGFRATAPALASGALHIALEGREDIFVRFIGPPDVLDPECNRIAHQR